MTSLAYRDADGAWHEVLVTQIESGDWQVIDNGAGRTEVVETLDGREEGRPQAEAIARDYITTVAQPSGAARRGAGDAIPEEAEADAHSDRRPHVAAHDRHARRVALPRKAA